MSENYEAARSLIDDEVFANCEYYVYSQLRDAVDGLESENERLRDAVKYLYGFAKTLGVDAEDMRELGIEVEDA